MKKVKVKENLMKLEVERKDFVNKKIVKRKRSVSRKRPKPKKEKKEKMITKVKDFIGYLKKAKQEG